MSNHQRYSSRGLPNKTHQQRFVPRPAALNSNPTLSDSLRQQQSSSSSSSSGQRRIQGGSGGGSFVNYLPQDEAVAAGLGAEEGGLDPVESQAVVDLLNTECSLLLKLNPKDFWREVASDTSLHVFLESFLKFRNRWYDFPYRGAKGMVAGVIVGEHELSRRAFMILYRISSNRDPGAKASDSLSAKDHAVILQEKKLLDLPKLLDICAIYGHENEELTRLLVTNAIKVQPMIHDSFTKVISHFSNIVHTMYERCSTSLEVLFSSHDAQDGSNRLHTDYLEVMDFINDAIVSMDALVSAYKHAAVYFSCPVETSYGSDELLKILARLHDSLLPTLQQGFKIIFSAKKDGSQLTSSDMLPNIATSLKMLSSRIVDFCWKLLNLCYLGEELFGENNSLPSASKIFPAQVEDPIIRIDILVQTFREISEECSTVKEGGSVNSLLQSVDKKYHLMGRLELLCNEGWISMDNEQLQFLSRIMLVPASKEIPHLPSTTNKVEMDEDNAIIESKISQVKDLFPDYGKGFISACLEVYNHNPEEVIQRILEGTLHSDLLSLDTSLMVVPTKTTPPVTQKDKGKGILVELPTPTNVVPLVGKPQLEGPSSTSSSVGRFIRKSTTNVPDPQILDTKDETAKNFALQSLLEYEDEYDDSFDDLGLSVGDSGLDDLNEKVTSTDTSASDASRWGSRQKPQFYVKDGKNYSYKVSGSVAAANYNEASIVNQAQKEMIHGLGRGGNIPLGAAKKVMEVTEGKHGEDNEFVGERGRGGRGRGGRRGGGRSNHYRKDQAMKKHFSGLSGF
ncbi:activating signal cointegrator 1 complex subunit 2 [Cynara cardunculus var. scolymus]|uniref:activating signal cointegrator 1 complex subunit 2 n=1 Tax=Cynara cardunculus var. scolymus TaxID=59895 RepID=UPI000D62DEE0|nr:activating signal cointegrator 1 complex subunit 2 [Cynara cardunculus var. scolymus]